jgi:flap endonuclease-1
MGIQGLTEYVKKSVPNYIASVNVQAAGIKTIALDGNQWMSLTTKRLLSEAYDRLSDPWGDLPPDVLTQLEAVWCREAFLTTCHWLDHGITPVWVIDGPAPDAKKAVQQARQAARQRAADRLAALKKDTPSAVVDSATRATIRSLRMQLVGLQSGWTERLIQWLDTLGVPWVVGTTEGEKVACMLWHDGHVDAVCSNDTDCLVYGCERVIVSPYILTLNQNEYWMKQYDRHALLAGLGLTSEQFTEFCIACGCDYNQRIPFIGPVKVHTLMKQYGTLDAWPSQFHKRALDRTCLDVPTCRALFACVPSRDCIARQRSESSDDSTTTPSAALYAMDWTKWASAPLFTVAPMVSTSVPPVSTAMHGGPTTPSMSLEDDHTDAPKILEYHHVAVPMLTRRRDYAYAVSRFAVSR